MSKEIDELRECATLVKLVALGDATAAKDLCNRIERAAVKMERLMCARSAIKPLRWRKPNPHGDAGSDLGHEHAICIANGIGGKYSITESGNEILLWWPHDEFQFVALKTLDAAKAAAEAHWQDAISRVLQSETV